MYHSVRRILVLALAATTLGGALAPAAAHAAPVQRARAATIVFAPHSMERTVTHGAYHEFAVVARFTTTATIPHARFVIRFPGAIYARPAAISLGTIHRGAHVLAFTVVVPAKVALGRYEGRVRLEEREQPGDYDQVGRSFLVVVRVVRPRPRPVVQTIYWTPVGLGTITVQRGQTVNETASFTSSVALTAAQVRHTLGDFASDHGVSIHIVSPVGVFPVAANTPVSVQFTISAGYHARVGGYPAYVYVAGRQGGGALEALHYALHFTIDVDAIAAVIHWQPANSLGVVPVQRGQTITESVSFTSGVDLTNAQIGHALSDVASDNGVAIHLVTPAPGVPFNVSANTPVSVQFTITAGPRARLGGYAADLHVVGTEPGGPTARLPNDLDFRVKVERAVLVQNIYWTPATLGTVMIQQGQTLTETASFTSDVALSGAQIKSALGAYAANHGVAITIVSPAAGFTVAPNTPVSVQFTISAAPTTPRGVYPAYIYVNGSPNGAPAVDLHYGLHFTIHVVRAPVVVAQVAWSGGPYVTFPAIARGATVVETATFTTNITLINARLVLVRGQRVKGVTFTLAPLASTTIVANTPTTVSLTITALPTMKTGGLFEGNIFVYGQPDGTASVRLIHMGLHFAGAVS